MENFNYILILKILGLAWFLTKCDPLVDALELISFIINLIIPKWKIKPLIFQVFDTIFLILQCWACTSFWTGWLMGGIWYGIGCYILVYIYLITGLNKWDTIKLQ